MSTLLAITSLVLACLGVVCSGCYLWSKLSSEGLDTESEKTLMKILRPCRLFCLVLAFVSFLFNKTADPAAAVAALGRLYTIITICWLLVLIGCFAALTLSSLPGSRFHKSSPIVVRDVLINALWGAGIAALLAWLFS